LTEHTDNASNKPASKPDPGKSARPLLGLQIPRQAAPKANNILLDPKETEHWFEALPMANIGETARQVYSTLVEFNRTEIPDLLRARTVEKFRPPVEYIVTNLQKHYVEVGLPLSRKGMKTAALARELEAELAIAYKIIVERIISGDSGQFDRRLLVVALHRALYYLGQTLLQNALVYITWPEGIWREINAIYAYASQNRIHQVPVKTDDTRSGGPNTSIEDLFRGLMLFASATPHRLRQAHARLLFSRLDEWSNHTAILTEDDGGTSLGRFNVDLWTDSPPMHNSLRTPLPGKRMAILDVRELLKKLRSEFEKAPWDSRHALQSGRQEITRPLLRLLIMAWSRPPDRRYVRTKLNFDLNVVAGLHAIYANLRTGDDTPYPTTSAELFTLEDQDAGAQARARAKIDWSTGSLDDVSLAPLDSDLISDTLFNDSRMASESSSEPASQLKSFATRAPQQPKTLKHEQPTPEKDPSHPVKTINESSGGYCIRWKGEHIPRVKIGELIGVQSPADERRYGLGVVRWMHQLPDECLNLGLEVIATRCEAGEVYEQPTDNPRKRGPTFKCLVINDTDSAANTTASLVMSAMNLDTGVDLVLSMGEREQFVRLTRLVEFSSAFARYLFEFVHEEHDGDTSDGAAGDEFNDLWSTL
jgi:hypothetical protein